MKVREETSESIKGGSCGDVGRVGGRGRVTQCFEFKLQSRRYLNNRGGEKKVYRSFIVIRINTVNSVNIHVVQIGKQLVDLTGCIPTGPEHGKLPVD
jgi:hypothetical protein